MKGLNLFSKNRTNVEPPESVHQVLDEVLYHKAEKVLQKTLKKHAFITADDNNLLNIIQENLERKQKKPESQDLREVGATSDKLLPPEFELSIEDRVPFAPAKLALKKKNNR